jgi:ribosomal protein L6P/L9E
MKFQIYIPENIQVQNILSNSFIQCEGPLGSLTIDPKTFDPKGLVLFRIVSEPSEGTTVTIGSAAKGTCGSIQFQILNPISPKGLLAPKGPLAHKTHKYSRMVRGKIEALFRQSFKGLLQGYLLPLELVGVGYRVDQHEKQLEFKLGYSHSVFYQLPDDVCAIISQPTQFALYGVDHNRLTQVGAAIKRLKLPESYKGKGIRLSSDVLYLKEMKKK